MRFFTNLFKYIQVNIINWWYKREFFTACGDGDLAKIKKLIAKGVDINRPDWQGDTALHKAINLFEPKNDPKTKIRAMVVKYLLDAGANVNAQNKYGYTPLFVLAQNYIIQKLYGPNRAYSIPVKHYPIQRSNFDKILYLLLQYNAKINHRDKEGKNALFYTTCSEVTQALIEKGIDYKAMDHNGRNALFYCHNKEVAEQLLKSGVDPNNKDNLGQKASTFLVKRINDNKKITSKNKKGYIKALSPILDLLAKYPDKNSIEQGKQDIQMYDSSLREEQGINVRRLELKRDRSNKGLER